MPDLPHSSHLAKMISQLVVESRLSHTTICTPYDPKESINNWLHQYELSCDRLTLADEQKLLYISQYLPPELANWIARSPSATTWKGLKKALLDTYGIPAEKYKKIIRNRLESLRQGSLSSRRFAIVFETVLLDFPEGHVPDDATLRIIYLRVMSPKLRQTILPNVPTYVTWKQISTAAVAIEESLSLDESLLEDAFSKMAIAGTPNFTPTTLETDVSPMEIDAFNQKSSNSNPSTCTCQCKQHNTNTRRPQDPMRMWTDDGQPICGTCRKVGHYSKKCRSRNRKNWNNKKQLNAVETTTGDSNQIEYAAIAIEDDPLADTAAVNFIGVSNTKQASLPKVKLTIQGHLIHALVDTGANISAIRTSVATKLGLVPDTNGASSFTNADNHTTTSEGTVLLKAMLGDITCDLSCHVVTNLSHQLILGYSHLKSLGAVIDTTCNEVRLPRNGVSGVSGSPSVAAPMVCSLVASTKLPGQHHAYVDITGPPNSVVFVSTPTEQVCEKLLAVAAGVAQFDNNGVATVKVANLDKNIKHLNKGQYIATYEYLSPTLRFYNKQNQLLQINQCQSSSKQPVVSPEFDSVIGTQLSQDERSAIRTLLEEFQDCFNSKATTVTPLVQHTIDTGDSRPLSQPPHRTSAAENETIDSLLDEMLQQGIVQPSNSPWASPVVLVRKHDGSPRFCVDYRRINAITRKDVYPLPRIDDTLHSLGNAKIFSTLDLTSSYWQIELDANSKAKSAFICRSDLYEFTRMPFGLTNAPATMQRLMDSVLAGLKWQTCLVYLDDIVCFSNSFEQHLVDLHALFSRLRSASLTANLKKCSFARDNISFLGYRVSPQGLHTDPDKIRAVAEFPKPVDVASLRSFLGLAGYYRSFIGKFSSIAAPLNSLLKKDAPWLWLAEHQTAYETLKTALLSAPVLRLPDFQRPFELHTDGACTAGIGVILCQRDLDNNRAYAVAYASRSLSPAERNYGVSEVEALAIVFGIKKFAHYLTATKFTVITDHHSLQFLTNGKSADLRGRLARWSLFLQQHDFDIVYRPGTKNAGPDALSRFPVDVQPSQAFVSAFQVSDLLTAQASDPFCKELRSGELRSGFSVESGILFFSSRPVLPKSLWKETFILLHDSPTSGHLGIGRTLQRFARLYYFPKQREWIIKQVNECLVCQKTKRSNVTLGRTNLVHSEQSVHPFDTVAIDTFGPLPPTLLGNRYVIVLQCLFSRYVCLFAVPANTDKYIIQCLLSVIGEHGLFRTIMSDNGPPYSGILMKALADHLQVKQKFAPSYHAASNGLVEKFMETLKNMISSYLDTDNHQNTWDIHLSEFQLAYNSSPHQVIKYSPFSVVHGREARTLATPDFGVKTIPIEEYQIQTNDFLARAYNIIKLENIKSQASNAIKYNSKRVAPSFVLDELVLVDCPVLSKAAVGRAKKLVKKFRGPFRIVEVLSTDRYNVLELANSKKMQNVHATRIKRFYPHEDMLDSEPGDVVNSDVTDSGIGTIE